jgi:FkbM family methyltransferase
MISLWFKFWNFMLRPLLRNHNSPIAKLIGLTARNIYILYENNDFNHHRNGEMKVVQKLKKIYNLKTIFDVGANKGDWTQFAKSIVGDSVQFHCFEVVPDTFKKLQKNYSTNANVKLNNVGLSDSEGEFIIHYDSLNSGTATVYNPLFFGAEKSKINVRSIRGDSYVSENNVDKINFLKIDVEGMEPNVLRGFSETLKQGKIDIIQFEYGLVNIQSKFLLKDAYEMLGVYNFEIGKIYPTSVNFKNYTYYDERFIGGNYLAVKRELKNIIATLSQ